MLTETGNETLNKNYVLTNKIVDNLSKEIDSFSNNDLIVGLKGIALSSKETLNSQKIAEMIGPKIRFDGLDLETTVDAVWSLCATK